MTPSDRVARRSHGIQQHGGGGAVGRLVPLPAGKRTCGVGVGVGAGLGSSRPATSRAFLSSGLWLFPPFLGLSESLVVGALCRRRPGPGSRSETHGPGQSVPGGRWPWAEPGGGRIAPYFLIRLHVHPGVNGGLGAQGRNSEKSELRDRHGSRLCARSSTETISCLAPPNPSCESAGGSSRPG